jgi:hypothetical protein
MMPKKPIKKQIKDLSASDSDDKIVMGSAYSIVFEDPEDLTLNIRINKLEAKVAEMSETLEMMKNVTNSILEDIKTNLGKIDEDVKQKSSKILIVHM